MGRRDAGPESPQAMGPEATAAQAYMPFAGCVVTIFCVRLFMGARTLAERFCKSTGKPVKMATRA